MADEMPMAGEQVEGRRKRPHRGEGVQPRDPPPPPPGEMGFERSQPYPPPPPTTRHTPHSQPQPASLGWRVVGGLCLELKQRCTQRCVGCYGATTAGQRLDSQTC